ncbi:hypothetical protein EB796_001034 [Bugula neritina]|uniref:Uncharacterized protein n=1 Tax=Bugula neritina TaxID=10212 RepID=A0A7J7KR03_BUGNE|nr:hypothetical protein EB796_001034 [Bugula neritina]
MLWQKTDNIYYGKLNMVHLKLYLWQFAIQYIIILIFQQHSKQFIINVLFSNFYYTSASLSKFYSFSFQGSCSLFKPTSHK